jgi:hypothetical protein
MQIPPVNPTAAVQGSSGEDAKLLQLINEAWMAIQFLMGSSSSSNPPSSYLVTIALNALKTLHTYLKGLPSGSVGAEDAHLLALLNSLNPEKWTVQNIQDYYSDFSEYFESIYDVLDGYGHAWVDQGNAALESLFSKLLREMKDYEDDPNSADLPQIGADIIALEALLHPASPAPPIADGILLLLDALLTTPLVAGVANSSLLQLATAKNWTALATDMDQVFGSSGAMSFSEMLEAIFDLEYK